MSLKRIPCEHDLLSNDPEIWSHAVVRCRFGYGLCGSDGFCHANGDCFTDQELTKEQAISEVDRLSKELYEMKIENDSLRNSANALIEKLNVIKEQGIKSRNSQRVFAIRYCISEIENILKVKHE